MSKLKLFELDILKSMIDLETIQIEKELREYKKGSDEFQYCKDSLKRYKTISKKLSYLMDKGG